MVIDQLKVVPVSTGHDLHTAPRQGSEREYIIVSFVRSTSQDEDVVTSVARTAGDSAALQEPSFPEHLHLVTLRRWET